MSALGESKEKEKERERPPSIIKPLKKMKHRRRHSLLIFSFCSSSISLEMSTYEGVVYAMVARLDGTVLAEWR